jgi:hypothetical protein
LIMATNSPAAMMKLVADVDARPKGAEIGRD